MPTPGRVEKLRWPSGTGIRVESGIEEGQNVGTNFDSMLAKLIVHAPTREQAVARMRFALDETVILGMGTNQSYLRALAADPEVIAGKMHTGYLGSAYAKFAPVPTDEGFGLIATARTKGIGKASGGNATNSEGGRSFPSPWTSTRGLR